jgi:hypothetical protein
VLEVCKNNSINLLKYLKIHLNNEILCNNYLAAHAQIREKTQEGQNRCPWGLIPVAEKYKLI